jgi:ElaB/YqjD/DUF883 family membrane-anchored ribosome-binding protein
MAESIDDEVARLRRDLEELRTEVSSLLDSMSDSGARGAREAWDRARRAGESLHEEIEALQQQAERKIGDYPLTSVFSSFGLGFLIGLLLDRRR